MNQTVAFARAPLPTARHRNQAKRQQATQLRHQRPDCPVQQATPPFPPSAVTGQRATVIAAEAGLVRVMQSGVPAHTGGMPVRLHHIVVDAHDLPGLARFWAQALGWKVCPSASVRSSSGLSAALALTLAAPRATTATSPPQPSPAVPPLPRAQIDPPASPGPSRRRKAKPETRRGVREAQTTRDMLVHPGTPRE